MGPQKMLQIYRSHLGCRNAGAPGLLAKDTPRSVRLVDERSATVARDDREIDANDSAIV